MPQKNIQKIPFDDRDLPVNPMSKERMDELEEKFSPYIEDLKQKTKKEFLKGKKILNSDNS